MKHYDNNKSEDGFPSISEMHRDDVRHILLVVTEEWNDNIRHRVIIFTKYIFNVFFTRKTTLASDTENSLT